MNLDDLAALGLALPDIKAILDAPTHEHARRIQDLEHRLRELGTSRATEWADTLASAGIPALQELLDGPAERPPKPPVPLPTPDELYLQAYATCHGHREDRAEEYGVDQADDEAIADGYLALTIWGASDAARQGCLDGLRDLPPNPP